MLLAEEDYKEEKVVAEEEEAAAVVAIIPAAAPEQLHPVLDQLTQARSRELVSSQAAATEALKWPLRLRSQLQLLQSLQSLLKIQVKPPR